MARVIEQLELDALQDVEKKDVTGGFEKESLRLRLISAMLDIVEGCRSTDADKIAAAKAIASMKGLIEKPADSIKAVVGKNRIMIIKDYGDDKDWQSALGSQQRAILKNESVIN